jgi:hypothetical protein
MVSSWRDKVLSEFTPQVARLTLVADPDRLLIEEGVLQGIHDRGFELIPFDDPVAFRFAYESNYRALWDRGEATDLVVVLRSQSRDLESLPYDLLQAGRKLAFAVGELFPNLSYPVVDTLARTDLDALYEAQTKYAPDKLGDNGTKEFVLRHVFRIAPELIKQPADLLQALLRRHYRAQRMPPIVEQRLVQLLRQNSLFDDWPLEQLVSDRDALVTFLQERWPIFIGHLAKGEQSKVHEHADGYDLKYSGPVDIPFDHDDVRVYVDSLFLDGTLHSIAHEGANRLAGKWVEVGLRIDPEEDRLRRIGRLLDELEKSIPGGGAHHQDWLSFAPRWAELLAAWRTKLPTSDLDLGQRILSLESAVDAAFCSWVHSRYASLHNLPANPPVMVHHLPRFLAQEMSQQTAAGVGTIGKVAMVVVDGLAFDQWVVLRQGLREQRPDWRFQEKAVFAWVPTVTSVSRQALFAGRLPMFFEASLQTTDKEAALWRQLWMDRGLAPNEVDYRRGLGDEKPEGVAEVLSQPKLRVVGLVVDKVDKIMHGMELGAFGMHNQVWQWVGQGWLSAFLDTVFASGFAVFLAADHGNIDAAGCGRVSEGAIADLRGERARAYPTALLRKQVKADFPDAIEWPPIGLPNNFLPLLAPDRQAFVKKGERVVSHGGISVEELIVPFIRIEQTSR